MDLALPIGDDRSCGNHFISVGVESLDGLARRGALGLSGAHIVGCDPSQARAEAIVHRIQSSAMRLRIKKCSKTGSCGFSADKAGAMPVMEMTRRSKLAAGGLSEGLRLFSTWNFYANLNHQIRVTKQDSIK